MESGTRREALSTDVDERLQRGDVGTWLRRGLGFTIGAALIIGLVAIGLGAMKVLIIVFFAILLAAGLRPLVGSISSRVRPEAVLLIYALFVVAVVVLVILVAPTAVHQVQDLTNSLPASLDRWREWIKDLPAVVQGPLNSVIDTAQGVLRSPPSLATGDFLNTGLAAVDLVLTLVTLFVLAFFWLVGRNELQGYALGFAPAQHRVGLRESWDEMEGRLGLWVRAQLTVMVIIGVATGVAYSVVGLPAALLLGLFAGIAEAIPIVGPLIGAIPALVIALTISPQTALIVGVIYVIIQFVEGNVLVPRMMKNSLGISPFVLIALLLIGGALGGLLGAFVAVPIAAALQVLLERVHAEQVGNDDPGGGESGETAADLGDPARLGLRGSLEGR